MTVGGSYVPLRPRLSLIIVLDSKKIPRGMQNFTIFRSGKIGLGAFADKSKPRNLFLIHQIGPISQNIPCGRKFYKKTLDELQDDL